ncbi:uncharacterized protein RAG0_05506 [Rhynchosporium agropyri]|uniref:Uncharacterized protein n=1 Tax=Rhynchosporium agropyri TaxID=914238 RepID=A0A1E1KDA0_9HELO|nr:uncharacterized protein RAG0_05506 [Rhynchosporium agropyri]
MKDLLAEQRAVLICLDHAKAELAIRDAERIAPNEKIKNVAATVSQDGAQLQVEVEASNVSKAARGVRVDLQAKEDSS